MKVTILIAFSATLPMVAGLSSPALAQGKNPEGINPLHYQCYDIRSEEKRTFKPNVKLRDQFAESGGQVGRAVYLCAPVAKDGVQPKDPDTHLVCYAFTGKPAKPKVSVENQFGTETLTLASGRLLCVPSRKKVLQ